MTWPTFKWRESSLGLAAINASTLTPYLRAIVVGVSPALTVCVRALATLATLAVKVRFGFAGLECGTLTGSGVMRARRHLAARFILHVCDAGHAARLFSSPTPARETLLRGAYDKRPHRQAALGLHTEPR